MKRIIRVVFALLALTSIFACNKIENEKKVAVLLPDGSTIERWADDMNYLVEALTVNNITAVQFVAPETEDGAKLQVEQIEKALKMGIKTFIICPIDYNVINKSGVIDGRNELNIICHDRLIYDNSAVDCYSTSEREKVGEMQAQFLIQAMKASNKKPMTLEIISGPATDDNARYYYEGAMKLLRPFIVRGDLIVPSGVSEDKDTQVDSWSIESSKKKMTERLNEYYPAGTYPDLILSPIDLTAIGTVQAIEEHCSTVERYPVITGQDNSSQIKDYILNGKVSMTIDKSLKSMAYNTAMITSICINGEKPVLKDYVGTDKVKVPTIMSPLTLVTAESIQ